jgi:hypothetical protein
MLHATSSLPCLLRKQAYMLPLTMYRLKLLLNLCSQVCSSWSFSAPLPYDLRTGEQWQQCFDVELLTAQPVTVTSHLAFQFPTTVTDPTAADSAAPTAGDSTSSSSTVYAHTGISSRHSSGASAAAETETSQQQQQQQGVCIALGSKRFDVLNWGSDRLTSLPNSMAQVRNSAVSTPNSTSSSSSSSSVFGGIQQQLQQLTGATAGSSSGSSSSSGTAAAQNAGGTAVVRLKLPATAATPEQTLVTLLADAGRF